MSGKSLHLLCVFVNATGLFEVECTWYSHMYIAILKTQSPLTSMLGRVFLIFRLLKSILVKSHSFH